LLIYEIRGEKVMLDRALADLYGVELRTLIQAVKRNIGRFPSDFMFQLTQDEWNVLWSQIATTNEGNSLRSQFVISKSGHGGRRYAPYVFTEQGVSMLSGVINSECAIEVNINIMRTFVKLRRYALSQSDANEQIAELRKLLMLHIENSDYKFSEHDKAIEQIMFALNSLIEQPQKNKKSVLMPIILRKNCLPLIVQRALLKLKQNGVGQVKAAVTENFEGPPTPYSPFPI
jgi:hypothetical protein